MPQPTSNESVFHPGELQAQRRAGFTSVTAAIRPFMPDQHREFFGSLRYLVVATLDDTGWPIATMLSGPSGFVHSPDPATLRIDALPTAGEPAGAGISRGLQIGVLGIDLATRRRNRANGRISRCDATGFTVVVEQSFGNCAQYIQRRVVRSVNAAAPGAIGSIPSGMTPVEIGSLAAPDMMRGPIESMAILDAAARGLIGEADTFFVASRSGPRGGTAGGVDVSHRGGLPGFIHIDGDSIVIPDFRGNRFFNTFGNLLDEPRAALLFIDFSTGDLLWLQGVTEIDWSDAASRHIEGAERSWRFRPVHAWRQHHAVPLRWSFVDYAPTTMRAGIWR